MKVIVPGSYDPVTLGHLDVIERAHAAYGEVYAVIFVNPKKSYTFSLEDRARMLELATEHLSGVTVGFSDGYVVDYMREHGIQKIVKGYRNGDDLEYERVQADYNFTHGGFETDLIAASESLLHVSSTLARKMIEGGKDLESILPASSVRYLKQKGFIK